MAGNWLIRKGQNKLLSFLLIASLILTSLAPTMMIQEPSYANGSDEYVTVRIEAGGLGANTSGSVIDTKTVLPQTEVSLSELTTKTAIYVVNKALSSKGKAEAIGSSGFYTAFGSVYSGETTYWNFYVNDKEGSFGLDWTEIKKGDSIVLFLKDWMKNSPEYAYFAEDSTSYYNGDYLYATADLILLKNNPAIYEWEYPYSLISPESAEPLGDIDIVVTKDGVEVEQTKSDAENGRVSLSFFEEGTYELIASKYENGKSLICPAYAEIEVTDLDIIVRAGSTALDTTLEKLDVEFKGDSVEIISTSAISYLGGVMNIGKQYSDVDISAIATAETGTEEDGVSVSLSYKTKAENSYTEVGEFDYKGTAKTVPLSEGENIIKLKVSNGLFDSYTHTLVVVRKSATDNSSAIVNEIITGIKTVSGFPPSPDWILAMDTAGLGSEISQANKDLFLSKVLLDVRKYAKKEYVSTGTLAKYAMALTALGIDARHIPDNEGNPINLIKLLAESSPEYLSHAYEIPYILMLFSSGIYDLSDYSGAIFTTNNLVTAILDKQDNDSHLWPDYYNQPGIDETAMILPALAKYYNSNPSVKTAVDNAIAALSGKQGLEGGFDSGWGVNSSSASTVAAGLISLGINPHANDGFIKNGVSLIDNILGYKTPNNTLGYTNNTETNELACIQGFGALASYRNLKNNSDRINIYDVNENVHIYTNWPEAKLLTSIAVTTEPTQKEYAYNASGNDTTVETTGMVITAYYNGNIANYEIIEKNYTVSTIDTSSPGTKVVRVTYQGHEATFNVTVKDQSGETPQAKTVKITVRSSGKGVIASDSAYAVEPGKTTVLDVLKAVLTKANKSYTIIGGYVSEIDGLSEFDQGENSGWMYLVNGEDPVKAAGLYKLNGGESIEWKYTLDYTKESGAGKWNQEETAPASKDDLNEVLADIKAGKADSWTADTANGSVSFDKDALEGLIDEMGKDTIEVTIEPTPAKDLTAQQKEAAGDRPVFDIKVLIGKKEISSFKGKLTISIPYKLKEGELPTGIVVYHINDKGELIPMGGHYDPATGNVVFTVDHLSLYVIAYDATKAVWPFTDVKQSSDNWYYDAVKYTYEKGIFTGTSADKFSPDVSLSRAMLASVLARISGADLTGYKESGFTDVDMNSWYGPSVAWAKEVGVVSGYENKDGTFAFRPDNKISRQDIAVMINNFNEKVQKKAYDKVDVVKFTDQAGIPEYAKAAVQAMQEAGIISGFKDKDGSYSFKPAENTSRAQAASLVYNMLTK